MLHEPQKTSNENNIEWKIHFVLLTPADTSEQITFCIVIKKAEFRDK